MKKYLLTGVMALMGFMASAQFTVTTDLDLSGDEEFEFSSLIDNMSAFYSCSDVLMVGITMADATADSVYFDANGNVTSVVEGAGVAAEMQVAVRYYYNDNLYLSLTTPWSVDENLITDNSAFDFARIGAGYSFNVWNNINVEPNYSMYISSWENMATGETSRRGKFTLGLSASF